MLRKKVEIDGREVEFKASAAVPRIYRMKFRRDLFVDLQKIAKSVKKKGKKEDKESSITDQSDQSVGRTDQDPCKHHRPAGQHQYHGYI